VLKLDGEFLFESAECDGKDGFRTIIGLEWWKCGCVPASALRLPFLCPALCISEYLVHGWKYFCVAKQHQNSSNEKLLTKPQINAKKIKKKT
jgi:hypothetical protein